MTNEEKIVGANHVLNFYQHVELLSNTYTSFRIQVRIKKRISVPSEEIVQQLLSLRHMLEHYLIRCDIFYRSLVSAKIIEPVSDYKITELLEEEELDDDKLLLIANKMVDHMNDVITRSVIKSLLESSSDIVQKQYG